MTKKYVLATANPGKISEMREILTGLGIEIVTRDDLGIDITVEETGDTFYQNAELKARAICEISGLPAIADDSGLAVDALSGDPGVYSSSYGGESLSSSERCDFLLKKMEGSEQRRAKFVCVIICVFPTGEMITAAGECHGIISNALHGTAGFGYDPVFIPAGYKKTMAELSSEEKNKISHRGKALRNFVKLLEKHS